MEIRVHWTHEALAGQDLHGWTAAVVDCLRATTSVAVALANGARCVTPCETEDRARSVAGALLAGERGTRPIPGFAIGNSPPDFTRDRVAGRDVALVTTNGTRALVRAAAAGARVVAFALVNLGAVAAYLAACDRLAIVCAGREGGFGLDDAFAAGALIDRLGEAELDDAGRAARLINEAGRGDPTAFLRTSTSGRNLERFGYEADVDCCGRVDLHPVVPLLVGGTLRPVG